MTLARGNLIAVLFGVSGGVGAVVALLVTPQFRALHRISVFVAFFAGIVLDRAALPDAGLAHDQALAALGAVDRIESGDGTLVFYRLPARGRGRARIGAAALGDGFRILSGRG